MVEKEAIGGVVLGHCNALKRFGVHLLTFRVTVLEATNICYTEEGEKCAKVRFLVIEELKGGGEYFIGFDGEEVGNLNGAFEGKPPELCRE